MRSFAITSVGYLREAPISLWDCSAFRSLELGKCHWPLQAALSGSIIKAPGFAGGYLPGDDFGLGNGVPIILLYYIAIFFAGLGRYQSARSQSPARSLDRHSATHNT